MDTTTCKWLAEKFESAGDFSVVIACYELIHGMMIACCELIHEENILAAYMWPDKCVELASWVCDGSNGCSKSSSFPF